MRANPTHKGNALGLPIHLFIVSLLMLGGLCSNSANAQTMQIPEIGALLPSVVDVAPGEVTVIDGLWRISTISKMIRIDRGRAYAIDGWNHLLILKIKPGMVVLKDITKTAEGDYAGVDLPLAGPLKAQLTGDRILDVHVDGALGKVRYQLIPQQLDDQEAFDAVIKSLRAAGR